MVRRIVISAILFCLFPQAQVFAQDERLIPSYSEDSGFIRNYPGIDLDVHPYLCTWKDSPVAIGHGGFAEQAIFTPGDPVDPPRKGALLKYLRAYNHGFLYGGETTETVKHDNEQVIFFVMNGYGRVEAGDKSAEIGEGSGVFIPAGLTYRFAATSGVALEVIIIVEGTPPGFKPAREMVVKNYHDSQKGFCCWAYTIQSLFSRNDGLAEPMGISVVTVENYGMGSPHFHVEGCEEIWLKIRGEQSPCMLGKSLLRQNIGDAFLPPPNGLVPHAVINPTERPMSWLYLGNRHDKQE